MSMIDIVIVGVLVLGLVYWIGKATRWVLNILFTLLLGIAVVALVIASPFLLLAGGTSIVKRLFQKARSWHKRAMIDGPV